MAPRSLRFLLAIEEAAGVQVLRHLVGSSFHVEAILSDGVGGPGSTPVQLAQQRDIPILPADRVKDPDLAAWIVEREIDLLLNVHSLHLIAPAVLTAPRLGAFNLHPGPLPEYAGLNIPSWAIYRGERARRDGASHLHADRRRTHRLSGALPPGRA